MKTLAQWQDEYPENFNPDCLDENITTFQLWNENGMLTAQLPRMDAINGIKDGQYYVISKQAVGTIQSLLS